MRLDGHDLLAVRRSHGQGGLALVEDIEPDGDFPLLEENAILATGDCGRTAFERHNQLWIGEEC
jgi:hypothetical protein